MKSRGKRGNKFPLGIFGVILVVQFLSCASPAPQPEPPLPALNPGPIAQEVSPPLPEPPPALRQIPPPEPGASPPPPPPVQTQPPAKPLPATPQPQSANARPEQVFQVHTVRWAGETLSAVAAWYTGDPKNWKSIAEANPGINPSRMQEGNRIFIPEIILKTREPMPREFVDRFYGKPKKEKPSAKPYPAEQQQELQLFGPRRTQTK